MGFLKKALSALLISTGVLSLASCAKEEAKPTPSDNQPQEVNPKPTPDNKPSESGSIKDQFECISIAEALTKAKAAGDSYTTDKFYAYGTITKITEDKFGNMVIKEGESEIFIYGTFDKDGTTKYGNMADKPVVGDEIVVHGILGTYNAKEQFKNASIVAVKHNNAAPNPGTGDNKPTVDPNAPKVPAGEVAVEINMADAEDGTSYVQNKDITIGDKSFSCTAYLSTAKDGFRLGASIKKNFQEDLAKFGLEGEGYALEAKFDTENAISFSVECLKTYGGFGGYKVLFKEAGSNTYTVVAEAATVEDASLITATLDAAKNGHFVLVLLNNGSRADLGMYRVGQQA